MSVPHTDLPGGVAERFIAHVRDPLNVGFLDAPTGAAEMVATNAAQWQGDVAREVTIQVRPGPGRDVDADVGRADAIAIEPDVRSNSLIDRKSVV